MQYKVELEGKEIVLERLSNGKFRIPDEVKRMRGAYSGHQPKPAVEIILVVSKGKTLTWLDDCRIPYQSEEDLNGAEYGAKQGLHSWNEMKVNQGDRKETVLAKSEAFHFEDTTVNEKGRFPANLLVSDDVLNDGKNHDRSKVAYSDNVPDIRGNNYCNTQGRLNIDKPRMSDYGDSGSYSRYFDLDKWFDKLKTFPFLIVPKASKSEKNQGCEKLESKQARPEDGSWKSLDIFSNRYTENTDNPCNRGKIPLHQNNHPTVKPLKLFSYLITMGSRENDIILDPFCGSGTTLIAADNISRKYIGIEINQDYLDIAKHRLLPYIKQMKFTEYRTDTTENRIK